METKDYDHILEIRNVIIEDYSDVKKIMDRPIRAWGRLESEGIQDAFGPVSQGQICVEDKGRVVGCALALIIDYGDLELTIPMRTLCRTAVSQS